MTQLRSRAFWLLAYVFLAGADFLYFLYSRRLSHAVGACVFLFVAVGWDWWFRRLAKENEVTKLNLNVPTRSIDRTTKRTN